MKNLLIIILCFTIFGTTAYANDEYDRFMMVYDYVSGGMVYDDIGDYELLSAAVRDALEKYPELYESMMRDMLSAIDEHSVYFDEQETERMNEVIYGEVTGIGINVIAQDDGLLCVNVLADSPAEVAGLQKGDVIIEVNGVSLAGMTRDEAIEYVRGPVGTVAAVIVKRENTGAVLRFEITRYTIKDNPVKYELDRGVAYISISSFNAHTDEYVTEALNKADEAGIKNVILDLRNNLGGLAIQALYVASKFVYNYENILIQRYGGDYPDETFASPLKDKKYDVVVLVNEYTASASEIVAGAIMDNGMGIVLGTRTYGKGTVQSMIDLPWGGSIKFTTATYLTPGGFNINAKGIEPMIEVKNITEFIDLDEYGSFSYAGGGYITGDTSDEILLAKKFLTLLGFYLNEPESPYFDDSMYRAVKLFQSSAGVHPSGDLDLITQAMLYIHMQNYQVEQDLQIEKAFELFEDMTSFREIIEK